ncbi:hypothetical protein COCNU_13G006310 [Cocos nucifera]|uniref:Uncharacterized protein n=1 Tax=Cocos nucifera TaxID=13894 RepID=A0A8K0NB00_COCNU|nr:hypothetical protein COCNU_13G006310 [Cocos nucifera]
MISSPNTHALVASFVAVAVAVAVAVGIRRSSPSPSPLIIRLRSSFVAVAVLVQRSYFLNEESIKTIGMLDIEEVSSLNNDEQYLSLLNVMDEQYPRPVTDNDLIGLSMQI